jgi:hypothetical protein
MKVLPIIMKRKGFQPRRSGDGGENKYLCSCRVSNLDFQVAQPVI